MNIDRLAIHPIKGFPPCPVSRVKAVRGHGISGDRQFAIAQGRSEFEPRKSNWMHRRNFLTNVPQQVAVHPDGHPGLTA